MILHLVRHAAQNLHSLADWRKHGGQERLHSKDVGAAGDPLLDAIGRGDIIIHANKRAGLDRYKPREESPLVESGLDFKSFFKINPGDRDISGTRCPRIARRPWGRTPVDVLTHRPGCRSPAGEMAMPARLVV